MCCFSRTIQSVSDTNIFARFAEKGRQYLVYSMQMRADQALAMILPIPVKARSGEDDVKFISLKKYSHFFKDMSRGFPQPPASRKGTGAAEGSLALPEPELKVVDVGSFEASFVPTVADFSRLDDRFRLPDGTWDLLPQYKNYGFAVFKLKEGDHKVHPMAFRFPSAQTRLFFPTVHIHDGEIHDKAEFDHTLYCQTSNSDRRELMQFRESPRLAKSFIDLHRSAGLISPDEHCYQRRIRGKQKNEDVWV